MPGRVSALLREVFADKGRDRGPLPSHEAVESPTLVRGAVSHLKECVGKYLIAIPKQGRAELWFAYHAVCDRLDPFLSEAGEIRIEDTSLRLLHIVDRDEIGEQVELRQVGEDRVVLWIQAIGSQGLETADQLSGPAQEADVDRAAFSFFLQMIGPGGHGQG